MSGHFKCPICGRVHCSISEAEAREQVELANAYLKSLELECPNEVGHITVAIESYLKCSRCGHPSKDFVVAEEGDAPLLATLPAIIAPSAGDSCEYLAKNDR